MAKLSRGSIPSLTSIALKIMLPHGATHEAPLPLTGTLNADNIKCSVHDPNIGLPAVQEQVQKNDLHV